MSTKTSEIDRVALTQAITLFLIKKAQQRQTVTYQEIALEFGLPSEGNHMGRVLTPILADIFHWSLKLVDANNGDPTPIMLTAIVVRKSGQDKGAPGVGFWWILQDAGLFDYIWPLKCEHFENPDKVRPHVLASLRTIAPQKAVTKKRDHCVETQGGRMPARRCIRLL